MLSKDIAQAVTDKIVASLESGVAPWVRPWKAENCGLPYNLSSLKTYRGINVALLSLNPFTSNAWLTYKQAQELGANVRKGEKGSMIVFYKPWEIKDKNDPDSEGRMVPVLRSFVVFNREQIDGLPALPARTEHVRPSHEEANTVLAQATIRHGGARAFYTSQGDYIQLPDAGAFNSQPGYYATALHELTHWTGHASRLAREYGKRFGDSAYAREELVAEMGAAFLCAHLGIDGRLQHESYIASWIKVLKEDKRAIITAASAAQKAADYCLKAQAAEGTEDEAIAA
jgi:antirestriction protein ArdC